MLLYSSGSRSNSAIDCVTRFCTGAPYSWGGCQQSGPSAFVPFPAQISHCCTALDPNSCFAALQKDGSGSVTPAARLPAPCATLTSLLQSCASASSTAFVNGNGDAKAQCLCLDGNGNPDFSRWDNAEASCYSLGPSSVGTSFWSAVSADGQNWCAGKLGASGATATASGNGGTASGNGGTATAASPAAAQTSPAKSGAAGSYVSLLNCVHWLTFGSVALYMFTAGL